MRGHSQVAAGGRADRAGVNVGNEVVLINGARPSQLDEEVRICRVLPGLDSPLPHVPRDRAGARCGCGSPIRPRPAARRGSSSGVACSQWILEALRKSLDETGAVRVHFGLRETNGGEQQHTSAEKQARHRGSGAACSCSGPKPLARRLPLATGGNGRLCCVLLSPLAAARARFTSAVVACRTSEMRAGRSRSSTRRSRIEWRQSVVCVGALACA